MENKITKEDIQVDIDKLQAAIAKLTDDGEELFAEEIANLNIKLQKAEEELKALAGEAIEELQETKEEIKTFAEAFRQKHGVSLWVAMVGGGFILWQVGAALLK